MAADGALDVRAADEVGRPTEGDNLQLLAAALLGLSAADRAKLAGMLLGQVDPPTPAEAVCLAAPIEPKAKAPRPRRASTGRKRKRGR